ADVRDALVGVLTGLRLSAATLLDHGVDLLGQRALQLREHGAGDVVALVGERQVRSLEDDVLGRRLANTLLELLLHPRGALRELLRVLGELVLLGTHRGLGLRTNALDLSVGARLDRAGAIRDGLLQPADLGLGVLLY